MRYHDSTEACIDILKNINSGITSDLTSHIGLMPRKLNNYVTLLQKNSLIKYEGTQIYITDKGKQYLNSYDRILEWLSCKTGKKEEIIAYTS
jgi:predicted transcriptional regulator